MVQRGMEKETTHPAISPPPLPPPPPGDNAFSLSDEARRG